VDDFHLVSSMDDNNLRGWGFYFTLWKFVLLNDGIHRCIILSKWMSFLSVTSQIPFFHIIGHSFERFKPFSVHVNQQANIGPNYVCLLHSYGNLCFCLHKYPFTFLYSICNYCATLFSYHGFHTIINYVKTFKD